jgi:hypothetical protein
VIQFSSINKKYNKYWPESQTQANHFILPGLGCKLRPTSSEKYLAVVDVPVSASFFHNSVQTTTENH